MCAECAGGLEEVHFFLWGRKELVSWVAQARASFQELPAPVVQVGAARVLFLKQNSPSVLVQHLSLPIPQQIGSKVRPSGGSSSPASRPWPKPWLLSCPMQPDALDELMQAAQQGRRQAVLELLQAWSLQPGRDGHLANAGIGQRPDGGGDAEAEEDDPSPASSSPRDRGATSSLRADAPTQPGLDLAADQPPPQQQPQPLPVGVQLGAKRPGVDVELWTFNYGDLKKLKELGAGSFGAVSASMKQGLASLQAGTWPTRPAPQPGVTVCLTQTASTALLALALHYKQESQNRPACFCRCPLQTPGVDGVPPRHHVCA